MLGNEARHREVYGEGYEGARAVVLNRNPTCQFCGWYRSTQTHHWAQAYPTDDSVTPNDLTALCAHCHDIATAIREYYRYSSHPDKPLLMLRALEAALHAGPLSQLMDLDRKQADKAVSEAVLTRNRKCQFCGHYMARYAHSWVSEGSSPEGDAGLDKFTALCQHCMNTAAAIHGYYCRGDKPLPSITGFEEALRRYPFHLKPFQKRKRSSRIARDIQ